MICVIEVLGQTQSHISRVADTIFYPQVVKMEPIVRMPMTFH